MSYSIFNPDFYNTNEEAIRALVVGVGNFGPTPLADGLLGARTVDAAQLQGNFYTPTERLEGESDADYLTRETAGLDAARAQLIAKTLDGIVFRTESEKDLLIAGWPNNEAI